VLHTLRSHSAGLRSVAWRPDGSMLATASSDDTIKLWESEGELLHTLHWNSGDVRSVAWRHDGGALASGSEDGTIRLLPLAVLEHPPLLLTWPGYLFTTWRGWLGLAFLVVLLSGARRLKR
jgi:WD40 repeat protein